MPSVINTFPFFKAFLEAGVSSYLENAMSHMPEAGWNLVKPWATEKRKGGKIYQDRFVTPEQGIYFIALNLQLTNVTTGILKASLVINDEFEKKTDSKVLLERPRHQQKP